MLIVLLLGTLHLMSQAPCCDMSAALTPTNSVNCHQYTIAYFKYGHSGQWAPTSQEITTQVMPQSSSKYDLSANGFLQVSSASYADIVVFWDADHSQVVLGGNRFISQFGYGGDVRVHGFFAYLNLYSSYPNDIRYYRYTGAPSAWAHTSPDVSCINSNGQLCPTSSSGCTPNATTCNISGYHSGYSNLATFNTVSSSSTYVNLNTVGASSYTWAKKSGAGSYTCVYSDCSSGYVYLSANQTITITITAKNNCNTQICSKDVTFSRSGGFYIVSNSNNNNSLNEVHKQAYTEGLEVYPNPSKGELNMDILNSEIESINILNSLGQLVYTRHQINNGMRETIDLSKYSGGVYYVIGYSHDNNKLVQKKVVLIE